MSIISPSPRYHSAAPLSAWRNPDTSHQTSSQPFLSPFRSEAYEEPPTTSTQSPPRVQRHSLQVPQPQAPAQVSSSRVASTGSHRDSGYSSADRSNPSRSDSKTGSKQQWRKTHQSEPPRYSVSEAMYYQQYHPELEEQRRMQEQQAQMQMQSFREEEHQEQWSPRSAQSETLLGHDNVYEQENGSYVEVLKHPQAHYAQPSHLQQPIHQQPGPQPWPPPPSQQAYSHSRSPPPSHSQDHSPPLYQSGRRPTIQSTQPTVGHTTATHQELPPLFVAPFIPSPELVRPRPAEGYLTMRPPTPPASDRSLRSYVRRFKQISSFVKALPFMNNEKCTADYYPGLKKRSKRRPLIVWHSRDYHAGSTGMYFDDGGPISPEEFYDDDGEEEEEDEEEWDEEESREGVEAYPHLHQVRMYGPGSQAVRPKIDLTREFSQRVPAPTATQQTSEPRYPMGGYVRYSGTAPERASVEVAGSSHSVQSVL